MSKKELIDQVKPEELCDSKTVNEKRKIRCKSCGYDWEGVVILSGIRRSHASCPMCKKNVNLQGDRMGTAYYSKDYDEITFKWDGTFSIHMYDSLIDQLTKERDELVSFEEDLEQREYDELISASGG